MHQGEGCSRWNQFTAPSDSWGWILDGYCCGIQRPHLGCALLPFGEEGGIQEAVAKVNEDFGPKRLGTTGGKTRGGSSATDSGNFK